MSDIHLFSEYVDTAYCPCCGDLIDYCPGHGEIGDPIGAQILADHDNDVHLLCHANSECQRVVPGPEVARLAPSESGWCRAIISGLIALVAFLLIAATLVMCSPPAGAASTWAQPYGGCKEGYQFPRSQGAAECRAHGWTVKRWLVVSPAGYVRYLRGSRYLCSTRTDRVCVWFATAQGNGNGRSWWTDRAGRRHLLTTEGPGRGVWV
jgi:hypothetical protein